MASYLRRAAARASELVTNLMVRPRRHTRLPCAPCASHNVLRFAWVSVRP